MGYDAFDAKTVDQIAARAGYRCSMPTCRAPTSGPSETRASGASNVGVAAHISAGSEGGPRYDPTLSSSERRSRANGIWLCQTHAKLIDDDETRFTVQLLKGWRDLAEDHARVDQGRPGVLLPPESTRQLVDYGRQLTPDREQLRDDIPTFLTDIGAPAAWGADFGLAWMTLFEIALNAATHGKARRIEIESTGGTVTIRDDGTQFSLQELRADGKGGNRAVSDLERRCAGTFLLVYRTIEGRNEWTLVDEVLRRGADMPCAIRLEYGMHRERALAEVERLAACPEIHLYPGTRWSYSDWWELLSTLSSVSAPVGFVVHGVAADRHIQDMVKEFLPDSEIAD